MGVSRSICLRNNAPVIWQRCSRRHFTRAGVRKETTLHTLRYSYATHLLENQVNLRTIQEVLGHTSPKTTALYTHMTNKSLVEVRQALDSLLE